jgi:hypothetical protein
MNRHCLKLVDVVGGRSDFIMANSCGGGTGPGRQWVYVGLVARGYTKVYVPGITALVNRLESGRGHVCHRTALYNTAAKCKRSP